MGSYVVLGQFDLLRFCDGKESKDDVWRKYIIQITWRTSLEEREGSRMNPFGLSAPEVDACTNSWADASSLVSTTC